MVFTAHLYSRLVAAADDCAVGIRDGQLKMHAAEIHNGHECHHQLQSRRAKLTTGNTTSMHMCTILLFELVPQTQKSPSYGPKCPAKNQPSPLLCIFSATQQVPLCEVRFDVSNGDTSFVIGDQMSWTQVKMNKLIFF